MPNGDNPDHREIWNSLNQARLEIAELKGMLAMHFKEGEHHHPPCRPASDIQKTMLSALGAALLALISAIASIVATFMRGV